MPNSILLLSLLFIFIFKYINTTITALNKTNLCFISIKDIDVDNFFRYASTSEENSYYLSSREKISLDLYNISYDGCDISNNDTIVKIIFYEDSVEDLHKIIQIFNIRELKYLDDFYTLLKGDVIDVRGFWDFYFGVTTDPYRYTNRNWNDSDIYLKNDNASTIAYDVLKARLSDITSYGLSAITPNYKRNRTAIVSYGTANVPSSFLIRVNRQIDLYKKENKTGKILEELYNRTNERRYTFTIFFL